MPETGCKSVWNKQNGKVKRNISSIYAWLKSEKKKFKEKWKIVHELECDDITSFAYFARRKYFRIMKKSFYSVQVQAGLINFFSKKMFFVCFKRDISFFNRNLHFKICFVLIKKWTFLDFRNVFKLKKCVNFFFSICYGQINREKKSLVYIWKY